MGQEFIIKSQLLEDKINQLLPSQGGQAAGVDLSASTTIVPIVNLTETAEGSLLRQDLQSALSLSNTTEFDVTNTTTTIINTTGYFRVFGTASGISAASGKRLLFQITDGTTTKVLTTFTISGTGTVYGISNIYDFTVFLEAGDSLQASVTAAGAFLRGSTRQIADLQGNLVNP